MNRSADPPPLPSSSPLPPSSPSIPPPSLSSIISLHPSLSIHAQLDAYLLHLHSFLSSFTYKSSPGPEHTPNIQQIKSQSMRHICSTAQQIIAARLPIKCLEAVVISLYLTSSLSPNAAKLTRMPLRFHTTCAGHRYWHIVLVMQLTWEEEGSSHSRFAAISLSRHPPLAFRPFVHPSLSSLCTEFRREYHNIGHRVLHMTIGLPVEENSRSKEILQWHFLSIPLPSALADLPSPSSPSEDSPDELQVDRRAVQVRESEEAQAEWKFVRIVMDRYASMAGDLLRQWRINCKRPAMTAPMPLLHPRVHWEQRKQQMVLGEGRSNNQGRQARNSRSMTGEEAEVMEKKTGWVGGKQQERKSSVGLRRGEMETAVNRRGSRSAFAV